MRTLTKSANPSLASFKHQPITTKPYQQKQPQKQQQPLFTISLKLSNQIASLTVYESDNDRNIIQRLCQQQSIPLQDNYAVIHDKVFTYLEALALNSSQINNGEMTQRLKANVKDFLNRNKVTQQQKGAKIALNKSSIYRGFIKKGKENKALVQKEQQQLKKAYEIVYKKSRDPAFRAMAQQYFKEIGECIQQDATKEAQNLIKQPFGKLVINAEEKKGKIRSNAIKSRPISFQKSNQKPKDSKSIDKTEKEQNPIQRTPYMNEEICDMTGKVHLINSSESSILQKSKTSEQYTAQSKDSLDLVYAYEEDNRIPYNYSISTDDRFLKRGHLYQSEGEYNHKPLIRQNNRPKRFNYFQLFPT